MPSRVSKRQVRRCGGCQKVGHNKATCPTAYSAATSTPPSNQPLKFFIHHVNSEPLLSPHRLNLKKEASPAWHQVESESPALSEELFHHYHQAPAARPNQQPRTLTSLPPQKNLPHFTFSLPRWNVALPRVRFAHFFTPFKKFLAALSPRPLLTGAAAWYQGTWLPTLKNILRPSLVAGLIMLVIVGTPGPALSYYQNLKTSKAYILDNATTAFLALQDSTVALKHANLTEAEAATTEALEKFNLTLGALQDHTFLQTVGTFIPVFGQELKSRRAIVLAGQEITLANSYLLAGIKASQSTTTPLTARLAALTGQLKIALPNYERAYEQLQNVDSADLPFKYQAAFNDFKILFKAGINDLHNLEELSAVAQEIFGGQGLRRYIIVFQNQHELRPTGGFMGSFALLDIKDGQIVRLDVPPGGTYDLQGQLDTYLEPPAPLLLINKRWEFQDANWYPDFPTTAKKILWFYRHSRGVTADGVIAVNASVLERFLTILGPLSDTKRGLTIEANSALTTIQKIVEEGPEKKINKPKQIISDLAPELIKTTAAASGAQLIALFTNLEDALEQKEIQAYFTDERSQSTVAAYGWAGKLLDTPTNGDYLAVINSNIGGHKSDAVLKQKISHQAVVQTDGTVINTVVITRTHSGGDATKLYSSPNISYLRLYVPEGATLLSASGFTWPDERQFQTPEKWYTVDQELKNLEKEISFDPSSGTRITAEFNKTVFGNWIITNPGETTEVQFTYRLPIVVNAANKKFFGKKVGNYQLLVQKQSGNTSLFDSQIIFPDTWTSVWGEGPELKLAPNGALIPELPLTSDAVWSILVKP